MVCTPCAFSSWTRLVASASEVRSFVISAIGTPSTPPSALARSRAIWTPAYSCLARGACAPVSGKSAPTLMVATAFPDGAVAHAAQARTTPLAASCRSRTTGILGGQTQRRPPKADGRYRGGLGRRSRLCTSISVSPRCRLPGRGLVGGRRVPHQSKRPTPRAITTTARMGPTTGSFQASDLLDALHEDRDERPDRRDGDDRVEHRFDAIERQAEGGRGGGGEHGERDARRRCSPPGRV